MTKTKQVRTITNTTKRAKALGGPLASMAAMGAGAAAALIVLFAPGTASAQGTAAPAPAPAPAAGDPNCPPGSWFCGDAKANGQTGAAGGATGGAGLQPLPGTQPAAQRGVTYQPTPAPPPVVVYQPAPPVVIVQGKDAPPPYKYTPRPPVRKSEWGLNLHLEGAFIGNGKQQNTGMGGGGLGLRFRPAPVAALEVDLDFLGGRDYNGYRRGETAFTMNCLLFVNPKSKAQVYFLAGFGWAGAHATDDTLRTSSMQREFNYGYFGGQAGIGMEFRLAKHFALNADFRGFVRGRTDSGARYSPEFRDGNKTTNTSGGALLTGGMTFYF
jgi:hypothetical protein